MSTWLVKGHHVRKYSHTTTWSRGERTYVNVHYWTPSTAGKTPLATCSAASWERWRRTAHKCSDPTSAPEVVEVKLEDLRNLAELLYNAYESADHDFAKHEKGWPELPEAHSEVYEAMAAEVLAALLGGES